MTFSSPGEVDAPTVVVVGIDLASRRSASCVVAGWESDGEDFRHQILSEDVWDTGPTKTTAWSTRYRYLRDKIAKDLEVARRCGADETAVIVEDVHFGANVAKPAYRTQGLLLAAMEEVAPGTPMEFVRNLTWTKHYGYKRHPDKKRTSKHWAEMVCEGMGYRPTLAKPNSKHAEDLRDAYLIARYQAEFRTGFERDPEVLKSLWING